MSCWYVLKTRPDSLNRVNSQFCQGSKIPDAAWDDATQLVIEKVSERPNHRT